MIQNALGAKNDTQKDTERVMVTTNLLEFVMPHTEREMVTTASCDPEGSWS